MTSKYSGFSKAENGLNKKGDDKGKNELVKKDKKANEVVKAGSSSRKTKAGDTLLSPDSPFSDKIRSTRKDVRKAVSWKPDFEKQEMVARFTSMLVFGGTWIKVTPLGLKYLLYCSKTEAPVLDYITTYIHGFHNGGEKHSTHGDVIRIYPPTVAERTDVKEYVIRRGINQLIENDIIAKADEPHTFFINVLYFHSGKLMYI